MPSNQGTQTVTVKFFDPVDSSIANKIALDVRKKGIYSGGYLSNINSTPDVTMAISPFSIEIGDGTHQVRCETTTNITKLSDGVSNIVVTPTTPYVILRWAYTGDASTDYVEALAVASPSNNDLIVGKVIFSGSNYSGVDYSERSNPNVHDLFLKVEPEQTPSMYCRVRAGRVSYGDANLDIVDQKTPLFSAPSANSRIDLVQIDESGSVIITQGAESTSPVAPSYDSLITLAEVTLNSGMTQITEDNIKDVRSFVGGSGVSDSVKSVELTCVDYFLDVEVDDGVGYFYVPSTLDGLNLVSVHAQCITVGTGTGSETTDIQLTRMRPSGASTFTSQDMLSTKLTIDEDEYSSQYATTPAVINTNYDDVNTHDIIRVDVDRVTSVTPPRGLIVTLNFQSP